MTRTRQALPGGVYLVVDPAPGAASVLPKVEAALDGGVAVLQVWNRWAAGQNPAAFVAETLALARPRGVPVLVHEDAALLAATGADGIHYDRPALTPAALRAHVGREDALYGVTAGNDLAAVRGALGGGADYVSFCSIFPSASAGACEIVDLATVALARDLRDEAARGADRLAIYASGGITPANAGAVIAAGADGVAVISGILSAADPAAAARAYVRALAQAAGSEPQAAGCEPQAAGREPGLAKRSKTSQR